MTIEQSELRDHIAREIRLAMALELTAGTFSARQVNREIVGDQYADSIMARIEALGAKP